MAADSNHLFTLYKYSPSRYRKSPTTTTTISLSLSLSVTQLQNIPFSRPTESYMASTTKFLHVVVMLMLLCKPLIPQASECNYDHGCFYPKAAAQEIQNRKVLYGLHGKEVGFSASFHAPATNGYGDQGLEDWELRKVPSGPDPLHHNGGSPKKPRITP